MSGHTIIAGSLLSIVLLCGALGFCDDYQPPSSELTDRLRPLVEQILSAWEHADLVCLGEGHARKNDADLRIALVLHPDFVRKVDVIVVEFANPLFQKTLDRLALDGEDLPYDELAEVWRATSAPRVWDSPVYEAFLRAVRRANLRVPRHERVRIVGGVAPVDWPNITTGQDLVPLSNRGRFIREAVAREVLSKGRKGLAVFGSGHCERRNYGIPAELGGRYPGKMWAVFGFYGKAAIDEARRVFDLGDQPQLIRVAGTDRAKLPAKTMFPTGNFNDPSNLGDVVDAIVYYGDALDRVVRAEQSLYQGDYLSELKRRGRIRREFSEIMRRRSRKP